MVLQFDTAEKTGNALVVATRVIAKINGKYHSYFMTNDFTRVVQRLEALGYRKPLPENLAPNPVLAQIVRKKMATLKATWSMTINQLVPILNYYDAKTDSAFYLDLNQLLIDPERPVPKSILKRIVQNDTEEVKRLVQAGFDIDEPIAQNYNMLQFASMGNACQSIRTLLSLGADINAETFDGQTPLMLAVTANRPSAVQELLADPRIDLEKKERNAGMTALHLSVSYRTPQCREHIIKAGANLNATNYAGQTPLILSIIQNNPSAAEQLIDAKADVHQTDKYGRTPLIVAAIHDQKQVAERLIQAQADARTKDINGDTAFVTAAQNNSARVIEYFLKAGAYSQPEFETALVAAGKVGFCDSLCALLNHLEPEKQKSMAFVALVSACINNQADIIHTCVDYGCDLDERCYFGMTPLMVACYANSLKTAAQLLAYGVDVNKTDQYGMTALMYAASKNSPKLIILLSRYDADRSITDKNGLTFEDYAQRLDTRQFYQLVFDRMKELQPLSEAIPARDDEIPAEHQSFNDRLMWYMQRYFEHNPGSKNADIYHAAGITKQTFSKILSSRNSDFRPKKNTVICLALGLHLTLNETEDLLQSAGYAFQQSDKTDIEIKKLLSAQNHNLFDWSDQIYASTGKIFFSAIIEAEKQKDSQENAHGRAR